MMRCAIGFMLLVAGAQGQRGWLHDPKIKAWTAMKLREGPTKASRVTINLDLPPEQRWAEVASAFKEEAKGVEAYFASYIPKTILPIVETIAADIGSYFPSDYAAEMTGLAPALGLKLGEVVLMNLIYEVEHIGVNCSSNNVTGPVPNCGVGATSAFGNRDPETDGPGLCTSIVGHDSAGRVFHGRNLDWQIPTPLRKLMVDVDYTKNGKRIITASQPVGFVGFLHGIRINGWSYSLNARGQGGRVLVNLLQALLKKSVTPSMHARRTMESAGTWDEAVEQLSTGPLINEVYYTTAGIDVKSAAVITRGREAAVNIWKIPTDKTGFFLLQTNYDHWKPVPAYDDRRNPGIEHMVELGESGMGVDGLYSVLTEWPTYNHHTDFTAVFSAQNASFYYTSIWG